MPQDVQLDVTARFDQVERQLRSVFGKPQTIRAVLDRSFSQIEATISSKLNNIPIKFSNASFSGQAVGGIKKSLQAAINASPLYINNVVLSSAGAASLRRSIQGAISTVVVPANKSSGGGGGGAVNPLSPRGGRGGSNLPLKKITGEADEFSRSLDAASARVIAFGATAYAFLFVKKAIGEVITSTFELDKALKEINVLLGLTDRDLQNFGGDLFNVARQTATGFDLVSQAALEFSRQGLSVEETLKRTAAALNLTRLSGLDSVKSVEALTTSLNSFINEGLTAAQVTDKLAAVDAVAATSAGGLAEGVSRVGSAAADAGVSFDELLALIASAKQITGRSESVIGNSLKTVFTRLDRTKVRDILGDVINVNESDSGLDILKKLAKNYDNLSRSQQAYVAEITAGVFQINQFKAIISDLGSEFSVFERAQNAAANSSGVADKRVKQLTKSLSDLAQIAGTNIQEGAAGIGNLVIADPFRNILTGFNKGADAIRESIKRVDTSNADDFEKIGVKLGEGILKGISSVLTGPGAALIGVLGARILLEISRFATRTIPTLLNLNRQRLKTEQDINSTYQSQNASLVIQSQLAAKINQQRAQTLNQLGYNVISTGQQIQTRKKRIGLQEEGNSSTVGGIGNNGKLIIAGLIAPLIADSIANFIPKEDKQGRGTSALTSAAGNIAGVGLTGLAIGGPGVGIISTLAAGVLNFNKVLDAFTSDIPDFQKRVDQATKNFTSFDALSTSILTLQSQYDDLSKTVKVGSKEQNQLNLTQQKLATEVAKLPKDLQEKYSKATKFSQRQDILTENSNRLVRDKGFEEIAQSLKQAKEDRDARLDRASPEMAFALAGQVTNPLSVQQFKNRVDEDFAKSVKQAGDSLVKNSALSGKELDNLAKNGKNTASILKILGVDTTSGLGKAMHALSYSEFGLQDFGNTVRQSAVDFQKTIKQVTENLSKQVKLALPDSAFFRNKNAIEGNKDLSALRESTLVNRAGLDSTSPLTIKSTANVDKIGVAVSDAFTQALKRNEFIKGDIANVKQQAQLSGLDDSEIKKIVEQYINTNKLAQEFLTNNNIALGATTSARTGSILSQSSISGISGNQQQGFIQEAIQRSISSGNPQDVQKIIDQLTDKRGRLTGTKDQVDSQRDDLNSIISALQIFVDSVKNNKPQVGALTDTVSAIDQKIDTATIDIAKATINVPDVATLPAFVERGQRQPSNQGISSVNNPFVNNASTNFSSINLPPPNTNGFANSNAFFPDTKSSLPTEDIQELKNSLVAFTDALKTIQGSTDATNEISINLPVSIATGNDQTADTVNAVTQEAFNNFKQELTSGLAAKGIKIQFLPTANTKKQ